MAYSDMPRLATDSHPELTQQRVHYCQ